ncbi:MAG: flagellar basal body-associated FliL family protein [Rhizobiaceae bacterium]
MASAAADMTEGRPARGPSLIVQIAAILGLSIAAAGMGWLSGQYLEGGDGRKSAAPHAAESKDAHAAPAAAHAGGVSLVVPLEPMTTNLAAPAGTWIRLEVSLVLDAPQAPEMIATVHQDILAYVRSLKLHQIEGPSGFRHFREDLDERAALRSGGHVRQVMIRTMLFE